MSKFQGYFKIVDPLRDTMKVTDSMGMDSNGYSNYSWFQRLSRGSSSRMSRYQEYDTLDTDVDVSRALDIIAEEMTNINSKTKLGLDINIIAEDGHLIGSNVISTLKVALKHWTIMQGMDTKLFDVSRQMIKYGDVFFKKNKGKKKWEYINATNVIAAVVDAEDVTKIIAYQIRKDAKKPRNNGGGSIPVQSEYETEIVPAIDVVRFTLNDDMSDQAPFGSSVLAPVYRVQKQKELLEDAIVIYRVQRAPERRVFYIDGGKMNPARAAKYLESVKNSINQKKIPSISGGKSTIDSTYNPQSMQEDFYFISRPDGKGSRVETLPGGQNLGELADLEYFRSKVLEGLRIPPSYLPNFETQGNSGVFNDGNVGVSYMQEIQFFKYVSRLQKYMNKTLDVEFKRFLKSIDIHIDEMIYEISLPKTTNYENYKESAIDAELLNQFGNADGVEFLSKRFILSRYLKLSADEIATNERMLRQERGFDITNSPDAVVKLYNPDLMDISNTENDSTSESDLSEIGNSDTDSSITDNADDDSIPS
jgi:hypothetical protein